MSAALRVEALKLLRSPVGAITSLAVVMGTVLLLAGITAGLRADNPDLMAQLGPAAATNWAGLLSSAAQITSVGGLLGAGVVLTWLMAREFTDGTISALFALPVSTGQIAAAKLVIFGLWSVAVSIALVIAVLALGLVLGYGVPNPEVQAAVGRQTLLILLSAMLATPAAWVATLTRSVLAGVGTVIGLITIAQVGALTGAGPWIPFAAPALWAMSDGAAVSAVQLSLSIATGLIFAVLTVVVWSRLQLNR